MTPTNPPTPLADKDGILPYNKPPKNRYGEPVMINEEDMIDHIPISPTLPYSKSALREGVIQSMHEWIRDCGLDVRDVEQFVDRELMQLISQATDEARREVADWATSNGTGISSKAIMRHMLGLKASYWGFMAPSDKSDRGRCIRLLNQFPEWWERLDEMSQYPGWSEQIFLITEEAANLQQS